MNDVIKSLKKYDTLQIKLIFLFFILTLVTSLTTLISINLSVESFRRAPKPVTFQFMGTGNGGSFISTDDQFREIIAEQIRQEKESFRQAVVTLTFILIGVQVVIALAGSYFVVRSSLNPLKKLNKTMKEINDLDLKSKIIKENISGEIGEVIDNFNVMIVKIQDMVEKEKQFTQNISHELKTPISSIRVNLESALILNEVDSETKESIQTAINSIDSLNKLIEDLTLLSSIEKRNFKFENFNAIESVNTLIKEECVINKDMKLELKTDIKEFNLNGSSVLFKRAICNLIENAIKYSKDNPEIRVKIKLEEKNLVITVEDNGIGIPKEKLNKIFERFYRIDESRSRATGGTGLGLAITKEIIELFNGQINVSSQVNKGTKFTIILSE